jgi:hypothetical protein
VTEPVEVSSTLTFSRSAEWDVPDVRDLKLRTMRHRLMLRALDAGLGLVTWPAETVVWCAFHDWDSAGHLVTHPVPAGSPDARSVVVTLTARARPLEPAEPPAAPTGENP